MPLPTDTVTYVTDTPHELVISDVTRDLLGLRETHPVRLHVRLRHNKTAVRLMRRMLAGTERCHATIGDACAEARAFVADCALLIHKTPADLPDPDARAAAFVWVDVRDAGGHLQDTFAILDD